MDGCITFIAVDVHAHVAVCGRTCTQPDVCNVCDRNYLTRSDSQIQYTRSSMYVFVCACECMHLELTCVYVCVYVSVCVCVSVYV